MIAKYYLSTRKEEIFKSDGTTAYKLVNLNSVKSNDLCAWMHIDFPSAYFELEKEISFENLIAKLQSRRLDQEVQFLLRDI